MFSANRHSDPAEAIPLNAHQGATGLWCSRQSRSSYLDTQTHPLQTQLQHQDSPTALSGHCKLCNTFHIKVSSSDLCNTCCEWPLASGLVSAPLGHKQDLIPRCWAPFCPRQPGGAFIPHLLGQHCWILAGTNSPSSPTLQLSEEEAEGWRCLYTFNKRSSYTKRTHQVYLI